MDKVKRNIFKIELAIRLLCIITIVQLTVNYTSIEKWTIVYLSFDRLKFFKMVIQVLLILLLVANQFWAILD